MDDSPVRRAAVCAAVAAAGCIVRNSADIRAPIAAYRAVPATAVLIGGDDRTFRAVIEATTTLRVLDGRLPVCLIIEHGSEALAVAALRAGASDYLRYPFTPAELAASLARVLARSTALPAEPACRRSMVGSSAAMQHVQDYLARAARGDANVLITGETGTGKELAAAYVHDRSPRAPRRFVAINCAAIPEALLESELFGHEKGAFTGAAAGRPGLLESANGGTVFLDEVAEMGVRAQAKILRAIESREVYRVGGRSRVPLDVRIVAATNQDLEQEVEAGRFRKDLFFRLNVASVRLPPLRERRGDIVELLDHYLGELNVRMRLQVGFSADATQALEAYHWPGNVRELKNLVESVFVCPPAASVRLDDLPETFRRRLDRFCAVDPAERRALLEALFEAKWNKSRAAEILECSRMTLYRRMSKYDVVRSRRKA